jgi:membrane protein DedA with SNARE-associated domain
MKETPCGYCWRKPPIHCIVVLRSGQLPQLGFWTYFLLAALVAVEGPVGTLTGAAAASAGLMRPEWVFVAGLAGILTGDLFWYSMGYLGKIEWLLRFGKKLGIQTDVLEKLKNRMQLNTARIMFVAIVTLTMLVPALIAAGLVKAPFRRWFPSVLAGELLWTGSMLLIGFYATEAIKSVEQGIEYAALTGGAIIFVIFLVLLGRCFINKGDQRENNSLKSDEK